MKKKILMLLTNAFDPDPRVHQEATALVENGYEVTILCWDRDFKAPPSEKIDGINVERIYVRSTHGRGPAQMIFLFLFWIKAFKKALSKRFHVVHSHDFDTLPLGFLLSRIKRTKLVYDAHESYVDMLETLPFTMKRLIYRFENILLRRADLLITVGEILREEFKKRGARNSCVVGNWKDPAKFEFSDDILQRKKKDLKISNGQIVVSFIANLGPERQVPQLLEVVSSNPDVFLIIGGKGPCANLAEDATLKFKNICYLGYVNPSEIPLYTALSDLIFYGFDPENPNARFSAPNKLFEALAAGKAMLTGNFGEIGEIVKETGCGVILDGYSKDQLQKAFTGFAGQKLEICKNNAKRACREKYQWKEGKRTLMDQYLRLA